MCNITNISRVEYDLVEVGYGEWMVQYRRYLDGSWEVEEWSDADWGDQWRPLKDSEDIERQYQGVIADQAKNLAMREVESV